MPAPKPNPIMKEIEVKINTLGRVRNSTIKIAPLMVFSGESGLGKSYVAILCHYFFELMLNSSTLNHFFTDKLKYDYYPESKGFGASGCALTIAKKDLEEWMSGDVIVYLQYMLGYQGLVGDIEVKLPESIPEYIEFSYKKDRSGLVDAEVTNIVLSLDSLSYRTQVGAQFEESPLSVLLRHFLIKTIIGDYRGLESTFVLPPSRGPLLSEQIIPNAGMYSEFVAGMSELIKAKPRPQSAPENVLKLFQHIQDGEVKRVDAKYVYTTRGLTIPVSAAAASVKEIAPLQILANNVDVSKCAVLIEEPEVHLHPLKQRMMADIVGAFCHCGSILQITTHSDYFLRRLNEIMLFDRICKRFGDDSEIVSELSEKTGITQDIVISPSNVRAYLLEKHSDGTSHIIEQNLENGVPFTSFRDAIVQNLSYQDLLEEAMQDDYSL
jgi:hypothetical protein